MKKPEERKYYKQEVIVFQKNEDAFGHLSNMATVFPVVVNNIPIRTIEALYQACRFPDHPEAQREVIEQKSPMGAKYKSRSYKLLTRPDWEEVKVSVMRWCLRVKLVQHWDAFSSVLLATGDRSIVEQSKVDPFWGAKPHPDGTLVGCNVLGRLLMELREEITKNPGQIKAVHPLAIPSFHLYNEPIKAVYPVDIPVDDNKRSTSTQPPLFFD